MDALASWAHYAQEIEATVSIRSRDDLSRGLGVISLILFGPCHSNEKAPSLPLIRRQLLVWAIQCLSLCTSRPSLGLQLIASRTAKSDTYGWQGDLCWRSVTLSSVTSITASCFGIQISLA